MSSYRFSLRTDVPFFSLMNRLVTTYILRVEESTSLDIREQSNMMYKNSSTASLRPCNYKRSVQCMLQYTFALKGPLQCRFECIDKVSLDLSRFQCIFVLSCRTLCHIDPGYPKCLQSTCWLYIMLLWIITRRQIALYKVAHIHSAVIWFCVFFVHPRITKDLLTIVYPHTDPPFPIMCLLENGS